MKISSLINEEKFIIFLSPDSPFYKTLNYILIVSTYFIQAF